LSTAAVASAAWRFCQAQFQLHGLQMEHTWRHDCVTLQRHALAAVAGAAMVCFVLLSNRSWVPPAVRGPLSSLCCQRCVAACLLAFKSNILLGIVVLMLNAD
jgi:hypothetical protein